MRFLQSAAKVQTGGAILDFLKPDKPGNVGGHAQRAKQKKKLRKVKARGLRDTRGRAEYKK